MWLDETGITPLYKQIAEKIEGDILKGSLKLGDRLLSINQFAEEHEIARDTVEKAYALLKKRGIIDAIRGKGYFISKEKFIPEALNVFIHFNKLSLHKKIIYDAFVETIEKRASCEIFIHHDSMDLFASQLHKAQGKYTHFVVIPPDTSTPQESKRLLDILHSISPEKLFILEKLPKGFKPKQAYYQDYAQDIYTVLTENIEAIRKYETLNLIFPIQKGYAKEVLQGFTAFCVQQHIPFHVLYEIRTEDIRKKGIYIVIDDEDLVRIIQIIQKKRIKILKEIALISYNDTALKEILIGGVSVVSTDFKKMGKKIAEMVLNGESLVCKNNFYLKRRSTF